MKVTQTTYYLPEGKQLEQLSGLVAKPLRLRDAGSKTLTRTFFDTYDWRVYRAGNESILDIGHERNAIKNKNNSVQSRPLSDPRLQHRLLAELDDLFEKIEKSTTFEQSVQRYAARISELYCDENGDITDEKSLEIFIRELIDTLLDRTNAYWPTSPLLAIFDGLIATVIRPLLYEHQTAHMQSETTTASRVVISGNMVGTMEKLATAPKWNKTSLRSVERYVEKYP